MALSYQISLERLLAEDSIKVNSFQLRSGVSVGLESD